MAAINEMLLEHSSQAAKELVDKFNYDLEPFSDLGKWDEKLAIKNALIAVSEKIETAQEVFEILKYSFHQASIEKYILDLKAVKQEIEKL